jgi:hypothetical protein
MLSTKEYQPSGHRSSLPAHSLVRAWVSVALVPVFLLASVLLVSLLYEWFGYKPENADAPLWVDVVIAVVAIVVFLLPCVTAVLYGGQANRAGDRWGLIPLGIGVLAGLSLTVLTVVSTLGPF